VSTVPMEGYTAEERLARCAEPAHHGLLGTRQHRHVEEGGRFGPVLDLRHRERRRHGALPPHRVGPWQSHARQALGCVSGQPDALHHQQGHRVPGLDPVVGDHRGGPARDAARERRARHPDRAELRGPRATPLQRGPHRHPASGVVGISPGDEPGLPRVLRGHAHPPGSVACAEPSGDGGRDPLRQR
jgi:hypothetical protein